MACYDPHLCAVARGPSACRSPVARAGHEYSKSVVNIAQELGLWPRCYIICVYATNQFPASSTSLKVLTWHAPSGGVDRDVPWLLLVSIGYIGMTCGIQYTQERGDSRHLAKAARVLQQALGSAGGHASCRSFLLLAALILACDEQAWSSSSASHRSFNGGGGDGLRKNCSRRQGSCTVPRVSCSERVQHFGEKRAFWTV